MRSLGVTTLLVGSVLGISTLADQPPCIERTIPVSITGENGAAVPELTTANLQGTYEKKPVVLKVVEVEKKPPRVILLIDISGSMQSRAYAIIDTAEEMLRALPDNIEVGLAFFQEKTILVALPTRDRNSIVAQLEGLRKHPTSFKGRTALWSAVLDGAKLFGTPALGDSLYLISDGGENRSKIQQEDENRALGKSGIRLFAFILYGGPIARRTMEELNGPTMVQGAVLSTGGTALVTLSPSAAYSDRLEFVTKDGKPTRLKLDLERQIHQIVHFYRVEVMLTDAAKKPKELKLELSGFDKFQRRSFALAYPTILFPCN